MTNLFFTAILGLQLLIVAVYDARHMRIPDISNLFLANTGVAAVWLINQVDIYDAIGGMLFGLTLFALLRLTYFRVRGTHGLGLGDVKFAGAAGVLTGFSGFSVFVFLSCLTALSFVFLRSLVLKKPVKNTDCLPFGPFLATGLFVCWTLRPWLDSRLFAV